MEPKELINNIMNELLKEKAEYEEELDIKRERVCYLENDKIPSIDREIKTLKDVLKLMK